MSQKNRTKSFKKVKDWVYRRGSTYYVYAMVNGTRYCKAIGPSLKAAEAAAEYLRHKASIARCNGDWSEVSRLAAPRVKRTFGEAAEAYLNDRPTLKASTIRGYREALKNYWSPAFGNVSIDLIAEEELTAFQSQLLRKRSKNRVNNIMNFGKYVFKLALTRRWIAHNPMIEVPPIRIDDEADVDPFSPEEFEAILKHMVPHYRPFFIAQYTTGARPCELMALTWKDLDLNNNLLRLREGRVRGIQAATKTAAGKREIPLTPIARKCLTDLQAAHPDPSENNHVFLGKRGGPINKHLDRIWRDAVRAARIRHRKSYQLRHSFASLCLQNGVDPLWLARVLGHRDASTTYKHYARYIRSVSSANAARLSEIFGDNVFQLHTDLPELPYPDGQAASEKVASRRIQGRKMKNGGGGENRTRVQN